MAQPEKRLSEGLGVFTEVTGHIRRELENYDSLSADFNDLCRSISNLENSDQTTSVILPIFASFLNQSVRETGYLYHVDETCKLSHKYLPMGRERDWMLSILEL